MCTYVCVFLYCWYEIYVCVCVCVCVCVLWYDTESTWCYV